MMNWRKHAYLSYATLRGYRFPALLKQYLRDYELGLSEETTTKALRKLLRHCREMVPYYGDLLAGTPVNQLIKDPRGCLQRLPVLKKETIRSNFDRLQSQDNIHRN